MCVGRGAEVGSDHHLVTAIVKLKPQRSRNTTAHERHFDVSELKNDATRNQFCIERRNRFETLVEENTGIIDDEGSVQSELDKIIKTYYNVATSKNQAKKSSKNPTKNG